MIWKTYIYKGFEAVQELDLLPVDAGCLEEVWALLLPISESAIHSCKLVGKQSSDYNGALERLFLQATTVPPSPGDSADEEEVYADGKPSEARCPTWPVGSDFQSPEKIPLLLLQQTPDDEKFTFGSPTHNDVVLDASTFKTDWVYLQHCVLYPDPDSASMILHNASRCEFWVRRLAAESKKEVIEPGVKLLISEGTWHLNMGIGFDFQIRVLRRSKRWAEIHNTLMTSVEISGPYQRRVLGDECRPTSVVQRQPRKPSRTARKVHPMAPGGSQTRRDWTMPRLSEEGHGDARRRRDAVDVVVVASARKRPLSPPDEAVDESTQGQDEGRTISRPGTSATTAPFHDKSIPPPTENYAQPTIYEGKSFQDSNLRETPFSRVVKRNFADGTVHAVKLSRRSDLVDASKSWKREKRILEMLNHVRPAFDLLKLNSRKIQVSIIRLLGYDATHLSLDLEFIPGGSLDTYKDEQSMCTVNPDAVLSIWSDLANGLNYIHARGIIHCDVKPENILMRSGGGGAVICDFGNAVDKPGVEGGGTPCYVPPEGMFGGWSHGGDIWALGVVMLFVTRQMALPKRSWTIWKIRTDAKARREMWGWLRVVSEIVEKIPRELSLLRKMLKDDPAKRIAAADVVRDLRLSKQVDRRRRLTM